MNGLEQRLRTSLRERGDDVEATPQLWLEVDRRITRRRWRTVGAWSLASVAAALVAVVVAPGLLDLADGPVPVPDVVDQVPGTGDADDDGAVEGETEDAAPTGDATDADDPAPGTAPDDALATLVQQVGPRELRVVEPDGTTRHSVTLGEEGGSTITAIAVRPGSTLDDLTAAVVTTAEGFWDLRTLRVVGDDVTLEVFPERFRPTVESGAGGEVLAPLWAPDGRHLAWTERTGGEVALQTIGWEDGPGTDRTADDNARFTLEGGADVALQPLEWAGDDPSDWVLHFGVTGEPEVGYELRLERQGDGALALVGELTRVDR
ncbi:MAG: hypothetical protein JJT89_12315 [Nitriliruptoraceae bacterium]|nr:hypothetical protein [Nitriliruptoraceae bacterium]